VASTTDVEPMVDGTGSKEAQRWAARRYSGGRLPTLFNDIENKKNLFRLFAKIVTLHTTTRFFCYDT
jgi:hypothetical protein